MMSCEVVKEFKMKYNKIACWYYKDTNTKLNKVCPICGKDQIEEDPCLGHLPGVWSACCGHGVGKGYINFTNGWTMIIEKNKEIWFLSNNEIMFHENGKILILNRKVMI